MSVFDADIQTALAVPDPKTDHKLPPAGALAYASVAAATALAGTNGHDALLLTGNRDRQMHGSESTRISMNRSHEVGGNQKKQISGNKNENVAGSFLHQTMGNMHRSVLGATNDLYTGVHSIAHKADQMLQEPGNFLHSIQSSTQRHESFTGLFTSLECYADHFLKVTGVNTSFKQIQLGFTGSEAGQAALSTTDQSVKLSSSASATDFGGSHATVGTGMPGM